MGWKSKAELNQLSQTAMQLAHGNQVICSRVKVMSRDLRMFVDHRALFAGRASLTFSAA